MKTGTAHWMLSDNHTRTQKIRNLKKNDKFLRTCMQENCADKMYNTILHAFLSAWVANQNTGFTSSCQLAEQDK